MRTVPLFHDGAAILCVGAHPDDIEIGCGGTLLALIERRTDLDIRFLVMTGTGVRRTEAEQSAKLYLGDPQRLTVHDFRDAYLPYDDPAGVKEAVETAHHAGIPDVVFAPRPGDAHQDHRFLGELVWQVFRSSVVLHYEIAKYEGDLGPVNAYVPLNAAQAVVKVDRLFEAFPSQHEKAWFHRDTFLGRLRTRGVEADAEYAEAFEAPKLVGE